MFRRAIDSFADLLADAFITALKPKLRELLDQEISRLQTQLTLLTQPLADRADVLEDTIDRVKTSSSLGKWLR